MDERWWDSDASLVELLREALRDTEPAPAALEAVGRSAYAWHDNDMELVALAFDSTFDESALPAGVRAGVVPLRAMTFVSEQLTIELEAVEGAVMGQLVPAGAAAVTLVPAHGPSVTVPVDDVGGFMVRPVPAGTWRLEVRGEADRATARTDWFRV